MDDDEFDALVKLITQEIRARAAQALPWTVRLQLIRTAASEVIEAVERDEDWVGARGGLQYDREDGEWS